MNVIKPLLTACYETPQLHQGFPYRAGVPLAAAGRIAIFHCFRTGGAGGRGVVGGGPRGAGGGIG